MLEHYSHIRMEAKRKALEALSGKGSTRSYGTKDVTNSESKDVSRPQLIEKNGGDDGTRTRGLCRDRGSSLAGTSRINRLHRGLSAPVGFIGQCWLVFVQPFVQRCSAPLTPATYPPAPARAGPGHKPTASVPMPRLVWSSVSISILSKQTGAIKVLVSEEHSGGARQAV